MAFDYQAWVQGAASFVHEVARLDARFDEITTEVSVQPPLSVLELEQLETEIGCSLPEGLRRLWLEASRHCMCHYVCGDAKAGALYRIEQIFSDDNALYGGASFVDAQTLPECIADCREWAEFDDPEQNAFWLNSVPFISLANGDYLGLDTSQVHQESPVVYLSHDDESCIIAPSFASFLESWEGLSYIGPEIWMLDEFRGDDGTLDATSDKARMLREVLDPADFQLPVPDNPKKKTPEALEEGCISHLKQISLATTMYVQDNDGRLPDARRWLFELAIYNQKLHHALSSCPASELTYGYAMNRNLSGAILEEVQQPERTVLFFECDSGQCSAHDAGESLPKAGRHKGRNVFLFADTTLRVLDAAEQQSIKWAMGGDDEDL